MAYYAVGDIQGCYDPLVRLLDKVNFDQSKDTLFCVGDLVNRGPKSLKTLRLLKSLENQCVTVLGNHDIHLLAMMYGIRQPRASDTLDKVINAPDANELSSWLRSQPLFILNKERKFAMCHAGIYPWWNKKQALNNAKSVEKIFQDEKKCINLLKNIYSNSPPKWLDDLSGVPRIRFIINAFTRMRFCSPKGRLNFTESGYKGKVRKNRLPWFDIPNQHFSDYRIIFGHWSALGLLNTPNHLALDTGCVWGKHMTLAKIPKKAHKPVKLFIAPNNR